MFTVLFLFQSLLKAQIFTNQNIQTNVLLILIRYYSSN